MIDVGVTKQFLLREYKRAKAGLVTKNCRQACSNCGAKSFHGGICFDAECMNEEAADESKN